MSSDSISQDTKEFVPLSVTGLTVDKSLGFDLYQRVGESFRLFKHRTLQVSMEEIERLKSREVSTLYVPETQKSKLYRHMRENLAKFLRDANTPASQKVAMLNETSATILAGALETPESESSLKEVVAQCDNHVLLALMDEESSAEMRNTTATDQPFHLAHAISVGNLSILLALACGIDDPVQLNVVGTGGLLHEIGLVALDKNYYLRHSAKNISPQSRLQKYPEVGSKFLERIAETKSAVTPVLQHRERLNGSGYPQRLKGAQISRLGRIVAICDYFDERTNPTSPNGTEPAFEVLKCMSEGRDEFDNGILRKFILMLGGIENPLA